MKVTHQSLANQTIPAERKRRKIRDSLACSFPRAVESNRPLKTKKRTERGKNREEETERAREGETGRALGRTRQRETGGEGEEREKKKIKDK